MNLKRPEFCIWAAEVHKTDVESLSRAEEKSLFKDFMEDYNTGYFINDILIMITNSI